MARPKKTLYTLSVDNFAPEVTEITFPLMAQWAKKHRYEFKVITERVWPQYPPVYEKFQIYDLARKHDDEYSYFLDADAMVHPDMFDPWEHVPKDHVFHNGSDMANLRWTYCRLFRRDGRNIAGGNWCTGGSEWTREIWEPSLGKDITLEEAVANIHPIVSELRTVITPHHLIDDYLTSRNIAKYGLKFMSLMDVCKRLSVPCYFWHQYTVSPEKKVAWMKGMLSSGYMDDAGQRINGWNLLG
ncbi:MAG: hypothetical protein ABFD60_07825 [Bryobacteraceae bacterium]